MVTAARPTDLAQGTQGRSVNESDRTATTAQSITASLCRLLSVKLQPPVRAAVTSGAYGRQTVRPRARPLGSRTSPKDQGSTYKAVFLTLCAAAWLTSGGGLVAKRKSFTRQWREERQRDRRERKRLDQARDRHELAADRERRLRGRDEQRTRDAADRRRREQTRERNRKDAEQKRQYEQILAEQGVARATAMTADIAAAVEAFDAVLASRRRDLAAAHGEIVALVEGDHAAQIGNVVQQLLAESSYPPGIAVSCQAYYKPESSELLIDCELPRQDVVPGESGYRYIKTKKELRPTARKPAETKRLYGGLIARIALRVIRETLDATPSNVVHTIALNGHVAAVDPATGNPVRPCLISVIAERDDFDALTLDAPELDPQLCLRHLNAIVSPHPYDLEAVRPVVEFDLSKYKFVEEVAVVAGLDSRPDLLDLTPVEFEHLVRELFAAMGMEAWVTQSSRDEGVDGVATNPDPVLGGLCVIQAKRYKNIVGLEAVHALAGVIDDKDAAKGILVTTSWFGKASYDFTRRNGRIQLIDGRKLKWMLRDHLDKDVLIGLPTTPRSWFRDDAA